jgi:hypothetical protein
MRIVTYTAITTSGRAFEIDFPLHPQTQSGPGVSQVVTEQLAALSQTLASRKDMGDGDVLQALAMTLAIRARIVDENPGAVDELVHALLDSALNAARESHGYQASRA